MFSSSSRNRLFLVHVLIILISFSLLSYNGVEGSIELSEIEELEIENQLKLLNKPANQSIKTEYGDIYDCVDFYKQPAFDHPLLKNHKFHPQMRPSFASLKKQQSSEVDRSARMRLEEGGCPVGTVPIRRTMKEDLIRQRYASRTESVTVDDYSHRTHYAIGRTINGNARYGGAGGIFTVYNPEVDSTSYSATQLKISSGIEVIQVGWRVDPLLYGDNRTRLFIFTEAIQSYCFDTMCPGFVMVRRDYTLGGALEPVSTPGKLPLYEAKLFIIQDPNTGDWWLEYGKDSVRIGFWPKNIFSSLRNLALNVEWGGETFSPQDVKNSKMGSGFSYYDIPDGDTKHIAYIRKTQVVNEQFTTMDADNIEMYVDDDRIYTVKDQGNMGGNFSRLIIYGGPGCVKDSSPLVCIT